MGWIYDWLYGKPQKQDLGDTFEDWEKVLCRIHDRMGDGAITIHEIVEGINIRNPLGKYNFLYAEGYIRRFTFHGNPSNPLNMSYLITDKGVRMAEELKGFTGTDGEPLLHEHL